MDGEVTGIVRADEVILSEAATIKGDVLARRIIVGGKVEGNIRAPELVEIRSKGKVTGDIFTDQLSVMEGAEFNGKIEMGIDKSDPIPVDGTIIGDKLTLKTHPQPGRTVAFGRCDLTVTSDSIAGTIDADKRKIEALRTKP
jgi:hypothetical protein